MDPPEPGSTGNRPSGTVTFLFTDIVGSTRLWQKHPQAMKGAIAEHDRLVRSAIERHGGYVFSTGGDAFCAAFSDPIEAALAAIDSQAALATHDWGEVGAVAVRMALDTGIADERAGDYYGPPLNRVSRIVGVAGRGEILTSHTTADLLKHELPLGRTIEHVGRRRLRDVEGTELLYRLAVADSGTPHRRARWVLAVPAVIAVAGVVAFISLTGEDESPEGTSTTTPPEATQEAFLWSADVGELEATPVILGDSVIVARERDVAALDVSSGEERWNSTFDDRITQIATDGSYVYVTTRRRVDLLHPSNGQTLPGCGFDQPTALGTTAVAGGAIHFVGESSLYRIATDPQASTCHGSIIENSDSIELAAELGPIVSADNVLVADRRGWYLFDVADASLVMAPDPVEIEDLEGSAASIAEWPEERRLGASTRIVLALRAGDGSLRVYSGTADDYRFEALDVGRIQLSAVWQPLATEEAVVAVDLDGIVHGFDPITGEALWTAVEADEVTAQPIVVGNDIVVGLGPLIGHIDLRSGSLRTEEVPASVNSFAVADSLIVASLDDGRLIALGEPVAVNWDTPPARPPVEPADLVRLYFEAWNRGDGKAVRSAIAPGAYVQDRGIKWLWTNASWTYFWGWFDHDRVMEATWTIGECSAEQRNSEGVTALRCSTQYHDEVLNAVGAAPTDFTVKADVSNSQIVTLAPGELTSSAELGGPTADFGHRAVYRDLWDWASETYPSEYSEACVAGANRPDTGACAEFLKPLLEEWVADTVSS